MKRFVWALSCLFFCVAYTQAQPKEYDFSVQKGKEKWTRLAQHLPADFYRTQEAVRIGDNVLLYQLNSGGWPKNIYMPRALNDDEYQTQLSYKSHVDEGTIDNDATTTEIRYLAKLYHASGEERFKEGALHGIKYLFKAQYSNGGWPQCYPRTTGYVTEIQYNDDSNVNVLQLMREVYTDRTLYSFVSASMVRKARKAFNKGVECILNTQVKQQGVPTAWCAQYHPRTLQPAKARAYELVSLSGGETHTIVLFLMSISHPSARVVEAVKHAVAWIEKVKIEGLRLERYTNSDGEHDVRVVPCEECPPLWARFYDIDTNAPFFCDRDGIRRATLAEVGYERRNGYSWYNSHGCEVLEMYPKWLEMVGE